MEIFLVVFHIALIKKMWSSAHFFDVFFGFKHKTEKSNIMRSFSFGIVYGLINE